MSGHIAGAVHGNETRKGSAIAHLLFSNIAREFLLRVLAETIRRAMGASQECVPRDA